MKRLIPILLFGLSAPLAHAESPAPNAEATPPAEEMVMITPDGSEETGAQARCLRETGTRIKRRDGDGCLASPGRSYSRDELQRTGALTLGEALHRLEPSVR
jgi:hypothetical protein